MQYKLKVIRWYKENEENKHVVARYLVKPHLNSHGIYYVHAQNDAILCIRPPVGIYYTRRRKRGGAPTVFSSVSVCFIPSIFYMARDSIYYPADISLGHQGMSQNISVDTQSSSSAVVSAR